MRIVFMGTPDFAVPCLKALIDSEHEVVGVFCQPDKPKGRKQTLTPPPVKELAAKNSIEVFQPITLKNGAGVRLLAPLKPDIAIVVAYGKILPKDVLETPRFGCINIHASLLPKYRGASPIQHSVINGDTVTGVTAMQMDEGLDTGDILLTDTTEIGENETSGELFERLSVIGSEVLLKVLKLVQQGAIQPKKQDENKASFVGLLSKKESPINWCLSAREVHNRIRGLNPWPCASTTLEGKTLKLLASCLTGKKLSAAPGTIVAGDGRLLVCCGDGYAIEITELQPEGKKVMSAGAFLNGRPIPSGSVFAYIAHE